MLCYLFIVIWEIGFPFINDIKRNVILIIFSTIFIQSTHFHSDNCWDYPFVCVSCNSSLNVYSPNIEYNLVLWGYQITRLSNIISLSSFFFVLAELVNNLVIVSAYVPRQINKFACHNSYWIILDLLSVWLDFDLVFFHLVAVLPNIYSEMRRDLYMPMSLFQEEKHATSQSWNQAKRWFWLIRKVINELQLLGV